MDQDEYVAYLEWQRDEQSKTIRGLRAEITALRKPRMIRVENYRAFHGTMRITPKCSVPPFEITADWLYKPDTRCWYGDGHSYPAGICEVEEEAQYVNI